MVPGDFSDPVMYGMTQGALATYLLDGDYEQAVIEMTEYDGTIPEFKVISDYTEFAITVHNAYLENHPPE